jgi:hypothetical protein
MEKINVKPFSASGIFDHGVGTRDERLPTQSNARIVEDPRAVVLVRGDDVNRVHSKNTLLLEES